MTLGALEVLENRMLGTRAAWLLNRDRNGNARHLVVHCFDCLRQIERGVLWHDERLHCPTWTDAAECRCDVEAA
jgi:hypothetical protein